MRLRYWKMLAAILGALIAIWLLRGDTRPEASDTLLLTGTVMEETTADPQIRFFQIHFGGNRGTVLVSGDTKLPLIQFLSSHRDGRIAVEVSGAEQ